jgi:hypothetical protein
VIAELEAHNAKLESKRLKKTLDSVTRRKRLGRGKFEPAQKPILGPSELPYSLRQLDPTAGGESLLLGELWPKPQSKDYTFLTFHSRASQEPSTEEHHANSGRKPSEEAEGQIEGQNGGEALPKGCDCQFSSHLIA